MSKPVILIVDDQADLRKLIILTLGNGDYELVEAADGPGAIEACKQHAPDLILLDLMLPGGMDGIEICQWVRSDPGLSDTRVVLLTAADQAAQRQRAEDVGVDKYLPKPFSPAELRELVRSLLGGGVAD
jgi:CheY-like chemotaxis protein